MKLFAFLRLAPRRNSAVEAKERLQILLAHERAGGSSPDYLPLLQKEILQVIAKYVEIDEDKVAVKLERGSDVSTLEVEIELPARAAERPKAIGGTKPGNALTKTSAA